MYICNSARVYHKKPTTQPECKTPNPPRPNDRKVSTVYRKNATTPSHIANAKTRKEKGMERQTETPLNPRIKNEGK
jgi:hypothetical protein